MYWSFILMEAWNKNFFACAILCLLALRQLLNFPSACKIMWLNEVSLDCTSARWPRAIHDSCIFLKQLHIQSDSPRQSHITLHVSLYWGSPCIWNPSHARISLYSFWFLKSHHERQCPCYKWLGTGRRCSAGYRNVCVNMLCSKNAARGGMEFLWGKFEPFIKVFEVEQRRRRRCVVSFSRSRGGCIPTSLRLCITAIPPASRMSLKSHYYVCSCCVLVGQKCETLQQQLFSILFFFFLQPQDEFRVSSDTKDCDFATVLCRVCLPERPPADVQLVWLDTPVPTLAAVTWCEI